VGVADDRELDAARALAAEAMRRFGHALHSREADVALLRRVAAQATIGADALDAAPRRVRDLDELRRGIWSDPVDDGAEMDHFSDCFVSGPWNPMGIGIRVHRDGDEAVASITLGPAYEGAPGRSHGGIVAAIFDDVLGCILRFVGQPAYTGELKVRYQAPTPIGIPLTFRARLLQVDGRKIDAVATAFSHEVEGGEPVALATASARFIAIDSYVT
jgi:acyl-coenzyme A thioesterase PaaI-like protein